MKNEEMKSLIIVLYSTGLSGVLLNVFTEAPGEITYPMIIIGLVGAVGIQWRYIMQMTKEHRQDMRDQHDTYRQDIAEIKGDLKQTVDRHADHIAKSNEVTAEISKTLTELKLRYEIDHGAGHGSS